MTEYIDGAAAAGDNGRGSPLPMRGRRYKGRDVTDGVATEVETIAWPDGSYTIDSVARLRIDHEPGPSVEYVTWAEHQRRSRRP